jgi:N-acetylglutamate synthase-like GNAT family acetyltransferase
VLRDPSRHELGAVAVVADARGQGFGALIDRFPVDDIWITTDSPDYFARFGFQPADEVPAPLADKVATTCADLGRNAVAMYLRRPG